MQKVNVRLTVDKVHLVGVLDEEGRRWWNVRLHIGGKVGWWVDAGEWFSREGAVAWLKANGFGDYPAEVV